jgi:hypothetical protein
MTEVAKEYATRDVSLAAFFRYKGHQLIAYRLKKVGNGRNKVGEWVFGVTPDVAREMSVEYANSEFAIFEGIRRGMSKQKYS